MSDKGFTYPDLKNIQQGKLKSYRGFFQLWNLDKS